MGMSTMVRQRDDWGVTGIEDHGTWTRRKTFAHCRRQDMLHLVDAVRRWMEVMRVGIEDAIPGGHTHPHRIMWLEWRHDGGAGEAPAPPAISPSSKGAAMSAALSGIPPPPSKTRIDPEPQERALCSPLRSSKPLRL